MNRAFAMRRVAPNQLKAAIAALHSDAKAPEDTDWSQIAALYAEMARIAPSPIVSLNRAVAVAMSEGLEQGLAMMDALSEGGELENYHLYHAARADLLRRLGRKEEALEAYERALGLVRNQVEESYLRRRVRELQTKN